MRCVMVLLASSDNDWSGNDCASTGRSMPGCWLWPCVSGTDFIAYVGLWIVPCANSKIQPTPIVIFTKAHARPCHFLFPLFMSAQLGHSSSSYDISCLFAVLRVENSLCKHNNDQCHEHEGNRAVFRFFYRSTTPMLNKALDRAKTSMVY
ncbi:hypothetical protein BDV30DRAFT_156174 [Aspergillus minisclerotigenes]|uniref:Uncharacterized protein n=1 Tax=Aspergillus minisclerotigenes TaxID=656917 RepID=A0A5N6JIH1_9EURO|nr:hypothetical protein BDV30DRAFT_156174 [Aspergillus minisclerotigenes]